MTNWIPDLGKAWLIVIPGAILLTIGMHACRPEPREPDHAAIIARTLSAATVTLVSPPAGPFNLRSDSSRYFVVYVPATKRTYYAEAYVSMWSLASDSTVYRYRYWRQMPLGIYVPVRS